MAKKKIDKDTEKVTPKKKKMTQHQKRQLTLKIAGWIMVLVMLLGALVTMFAPLLFG